MDFGRQMTGIILGLLVAGLLIAFLLPVAISELVGVDTTAWGSAEAGLFELIPLFLVLVPIIALIVYAMRTY